MASLYICKIVSFYEKNRNMFHKNQHVYHYALKIFSTQFTALPYMMLDLTWHVLKIIQKLTSPSQVPNSLKKLKFL